MLYHCRKNVYAAESALVQHWCRCGWGKIGQSVWIRSVTWSPLCEKLHSKLLPNVAVMLVQRRRQWPNITATFGKWPVVAAYECGHYSFIHIRVTKVDLLNARSPPSKHETSIQYWPNVNVAGTILVRCIVFAGRLQSVEYDGVCSDFVCKGDPVSYWYHNGQGLQTMNHKIKAVFWLDRCRCQWSNLTPPLDLLLVLSLLVTMIIQMQLCIMTVNGLIQRVGPLQTQSRPTVNNHHISPYLLTTDS